MNSEDLTRFIAFLESLDGPTPATLRLIEDKKRQLAAQTAEEAA